MVTYTGRMVTTNEETARNIAAAIARQNRSKKSVADAAGIPRSTFDRKVNGRAEITVTDVAMLADTLGIPPWELLPGRFSPPTPAAADAA